MSTQSAPKPRQLMYPRDGPGSFTVPSTKGGSIQRMVGLRDYMEIYTEHETFRFQTPESIDPGRTNPNAMFVQTKVADVGTSSPYIARTIVMANDMLASKVVVKEEKLVALMLQVHRIKETLLQCAYAADGFQAAFDDEFRKLNENGGKRAPGAQMLAYFPVIQDIDAKLTAFLIPARRAISDICQLPSHFWGIKLQHSDPSYLLEKELMPLLGPDHRMVQWLKSRLTMTKALIDFRNGQEHTATTKGAKLIIKNFEMLPTNQIAVPVWGVEAADMTDVCVDLKGMMGFLLGFAEVMLVACIDANLPEFPPMKMLCVEKPESACPVGYVLEVDHEKLFKTSATGK